MRTLPPAWDRLLRLSILVLASLGFLAWSTYYQRDLGAFGCDPFGYARQAEIFRHEGIFSGVDTQVRDLEALELVGVAEQLFSNSDLWSEAVAPHCHHFNKLSNKIVLQYPPGTGLLLSFFPEEIALSSTFAVGAILIVFVFLVFGFWQEPSWQSVILSTLFFCLLGWTLSRAEAFSSASIPLSISLTPLTVALSMVAFSGPRQPTNNMAAVFLGFVGGLLLSIRLPNALLLVGLAVQILITMQLWHFSNFKKSFPALLIGLASFLATTSFFVLRSNLVNAGGIFETTYSPIDASLPVLKFDQLLQATSYYFADTFASPFLIFACALGVYRLVTLKDHLTNDRFLGASAGCGVALLASIVFFVTHSIKIPYYLLPASVFAASVVVLDTLIGKKREQKVPRVFVFSAVAAAVFVVARIFLLSPYTPVVTLPQEVLSRRAIVWSDLSSGTILYYLGKFGSKIVFAPADVQDALVDRVHNIGRTQYIVVDSAAMQSVLSRLMLNYNFKDVGMFNSPFGAFPVWKLTGRK